MDAMRKSPILISRHRLSPHSIFCVGKNYRLHALEMLMMEGAAPQAAASPDPEPIIFMKPATALAPDAIIRMPHFEGRPLSRLMHFEAEIVLLVGRDTDGCPEEGAMEYISAIGAGLDMTLRDVQLEAKKAGNPWLKSKGFRSSALVSDLVRLDGSIPGDDWSISLHCNGVLLQHATLGEMIHTPSALVHYLSYLYGLRQGDLIFTGTPAGVGPVSPGDSLRASLSMPDASGAPLELAVLEATVEKEHNP
ncbi:MAG: fumarylacetoacetate hydrolase [Pelodictyon luteolum]|uniref:Fumarylacetoacetate hydrolase n=1 Tax=Pelodictyon luteolum TaxID=1100 RepID=A0A165LP64_PELLU|nr:fumarylacetoacetate hydrolase family protein [Pelodictyon luteolum]KZK74255.1 MAG: fumarylacetoacetate hydrolase [Pelodictyon luteolum]